ncbi:MAG: cell division topological specificity factor MinE [Gammaproteobacteria bacterium]|nr:cell division topological specificity factor MinE [Gammaproteobacteria bacterium]
MKWLKELFLPSNQSACLAKERLQVIVAHERSHRQGPDFLQQLQQEITAVIAKYVNIGLGDVVVDFEQKGDRSVLELNITLPDQTSAKVNTPAAGQTA